MRKDLNNPSFYFKTLKKEKQNKLKVSRRKEVVDIIAEIYEIETRNIIERISEKSDYSKIINKIDKLVARLTKINRERTQITNIKNGIRNIPTDVMTIKKIRKHNEQIYIYKF